ncbi:PX-SNX-like domain protein (macronuclear) [Tetrahymena thermophila SB210]|uniref:PX-SNX-like domain protein n=1 Tax=Tetrahymena thermophila (strain SB210) TaxID=312017 RepID=Q23CV3_TETTS|nr:PX-SNX-like domain protein [Tetrahymena thermophila SB210]EAR94435.2 PX-SNX-like domain protein [Tetrahymena thermophila SB210]|eukprot:XP_001014933.2 PX-SNX-like domain protein [Tetrahymena thermophila SB210]
MFIMDSLEISDSSSESQHELKKAEKIEYSSVCSTDDELNLHLSPQSDISLPRNINRPSVKKSSVVNQLEQEEVPPMPMPRTIFGFLERKIQLKNAMKVQENNNNNNTNNNNINIQSAVVPSKVSCVQCQQSQQIISSIHFNIKDHEFVSEEEGSEDECTASNENGGQENANQVYQQKSGQKKFVVYQIEAVETKRRGKKILSKESWNFTSRYSMLRELYHSLKKEISDFSSLNLPKFPGKKWFGNTDEKFLSERKRDLQIFFSALSKCKVAMQSKTVQELITESRELADEEFRL